MSCTTILIGKAASYNGATIIARDDDSGSGRYDPKRFVVVRPEDQPRRYRSVLSHVEIDLPDDPCRYTIAPNVLPNRGVLAEAGVNVHNVAMSATETIAVNERVLAADPLVELRPAQGQPGDADYVPERPGGIGEEDIITLVLPYVATAREGVIRLGGLLERYGTYESNGIAISDADEIWYVETIGGHHWIARRVPDDCYATIPNQLGIDEFDLDDAFGQRREHMCSADLIEFIERHHLDMAMNRGPHHLDTRAAFGTATTKDHIYNTPRAWYMQRYLNPGEDWDSPNARYTPTSDDIPWCREPERKVSVEDVDFLMSSHFEGTPYDPYGTLGTPESRHRYRPIGINRTGHMVAMELRGDVPARAPRGDVGVVRFGTVQRGGAVLCECAGYARLSAGYAGRAVHRFVLLVDPHDRRDGGPALHRMLERHRAVCGAGAQLRAPACVRHRRGTGRCRRDGWDGCGRGTAHRGERGHGQEPAATHHRAAWPVCCTHPAT